jgi:CRISPR-associated protein Cas1
MLDIGGKMQKSIYVYTNGQLSRKDNTIRFIDENNTTRDLPVEQVSEIYVMSQMDLNTAFLNLASQNKIMLHFFNYYDFYIGSFYPREQYLAGNLLVKQSEYYLDYNKRIELAKAFIEAASFNIYRNLRYYNGRGKDLQQSMDNIVGLRKAIEKCKTIQELMGVEGNIRKEYYSTWNTIVSQNINFQKRVMNPPDNYINSLISYVNSLIYTKTLSQIYRTQLNPTISYLHEPGVRRFSLCLDISEIFKPLIGDRLIFSLLNRNQITEKSFTKELNGLHLTKEASRTITEELDHRLKKTIFHRELEKDVSYEYLMRLEVYKLIKHILGEKQYKGFEIWW